MKHGLYLPNFGPFGEASVVAELAREAEAAGWDGFFIWDHIARDFQTAVSDPWVALTAVAMATERIRFGAMVTPIARRRPWQLARATVTLDRLSKGRLIFGAGLGSQGGAEVEWGAFGEEQDLRQRAEMLDEGLDLLSLFWSGQAFSYEGDHYQANVSQGFRPEPVQAPRIPVWIAGYWPAKPPMRRASRWDGVFPLYREADPLPELEACVDFIRQERGGLDGFEVVHLAGPILESQHARAAEIRAPFEKAGATWWLERLLPFDFGGDLHGDWNFAAMRDRVLRGPG